MASSSSSSSSSASLKLLCALLLAMVVAAPVAAITCGQVTNSLAQCIGYLQKGGPLPPGCCGGIRTLNAAAKTTPDRQQVCNCLKSAAGQIRGVNYGLAAGLPGKCGVSIPYKISPKTDCSKVR